MLLCTALRAQARRLCFDSAIGVVRTLFWLLSSLVQPLCKNLRRFADGASDVDWGEAICATMTPRGHLGGSSLHSVQTIVFLQLFILVLGGGNNVQQGPPQVLLGASLLRISHLGVAKFANWLPPHFTSMFAIRMGCVCRVPAESPGQPCRVVPPNPNINQNRSNLIRPVCHPARHKASVGILG